MTAARLSATATLLMAAVYVFALGTHAGREIDRAVLAENPTKLHDFFAAIVVILLNPVTVALVGLAAVDRARRLGGVPAAVGIAIVLVGPALTAHGLKAALGALDPVGGEGYRVLGRAFFPSGHAAMAMTLAVVAVCAAAPRRRRTMAVFTGAAAGGYGSLIFMSVNHHAFDVVGGILLAVAWAAAVIGCWPQVGVMHCGAEREEVTAGGVTLRRLALALTFVMAGALTVFGMPPWRGHLAGLVILVTLTTLVLALAFARALASTTAPVRPQAAAR